MKKLLFLVLACGAFYLAKIVAELPLPPDTQLMKYVLVLQGLFFLAVFISELSLPKPSFPRLKATTYEVTYGWNYSRPIATLTPVGNNEGRAIEYPSHTPPLGHREEFPPFSPKTLWVPE